MELAPGTRLGPYEILALLGAGGMGEVYRAQDTRLDRTVAIKILSQPYYDPGRKQRFEREAKAISCLNHPNICTLHDIGHQDGVGYLVMECVEGETLARRLEKGPLPIDQVLKIGAQIADALDKAHHAGIVHRDLKPGNIMLTSSGAKLLDFGLAKPSAALTEMATMTATNVQTPVTERGTIVGTFQYMSPEQVEGRELDGRSDIFSLGTVLYEMVTGHHAFEGKSRLSIASAILEKEPAPITTVKPLAPTALDHAIRTCLAKDPNDRWQTARDLSHELKWIREAGSQAGTPAVPGQSSRSGRERVAWATAATLLLGALAVLGVAYFKRSDRPAMIIRSAIPSPPSNPFNPASSATWRPVLSPDGKQIVVPVLGSNGKNALWLRTLKDAGEGRMLPGTEDGTGPFWSPDGRSIGFVTVNGKLKRIDIEGNLVQSLSDVTGLRGAAWSPSGVILFTPAPFSPLYEIPATGGTPRQVTQLNTSRKEQSHRWPVFLSDGKHFLFFVRSEEQPEVSGIYAGSLDSKEDHLVVKATAGPAFATGGTIVYMRDGVLLTQAFDERKLAVSGEPSALPDQVSFNATSTTALFSISPMDDMIYYPTPPGGPVALTWFDRSGRQINTIDPGGYVLGGLALSPIGPHAVVSIMSPDGLNSNLWDFDLKRGSRTRLTSGPEDKTSPVWQPDGQTVLFASRFGGKPGHIDRTRSDGSGGVETVLNVDSGTVLAPGSVCRNGQYFAYTEVAISGKSPGAIRILPFTGNRDPFTLAQIQFLVPPNGNGPRFSPDCKWIAYVSGDTRGADVYLTHFPDSTRIYQVSTHGGVYPRWGADGKELFYYSRTDSNVMAVNVNEKADGLSLDTPRMLFHYRFIGVGYGFDVTPDGQRFLIVTSNDSPSTPLTLVTNWEAELKKK